LNSIKLHSDNLFLIIHDINYHRTLRFFLKYFHCHQSFQQIQQTMQHVDVFDPVFTKQNEHILFSCFSNLQLVS
jgi:hypothetical protein